MGDAARKERIPGSRVDAESAGIARFVERRDGSAHDSGGLEMRRRTAVGQCAARALDEVERGEASETGSNSSGPSESTLATSVIVPRTVGPARSSSRAKPAKTPGG